MKLSSTGQLTFGTFVGGSGLDGAESIALDLEGNILIAGFTNSPNFPVPNGVDTSLSAK